MSSRQKRYIQKYRTSWESMSLFKGWLKPLPKNEGKAYCSVCNVIIKAHLCDLRKHASSLKHRRAIKLVATLKNMGTTESYEGVGLQEAECSDEEFIGVRWSKDAVLTLLKYVKEHWSDFNNRQKKKKDVFEEVAEAMKFDGFDVSGLDCMRKYTNLRLSYYAIIEKANKGESETPKQFYFAAMNELLNSDPDTDTYYSDMKNEGVLLDDSFSNDNIDIEISNIKSDHAGDYDWSINATMVFLNFLLEFNDFFSNKEEEDEHTIWLAVSEQMKLEGHQVDEFSCLYKWRSLLMEYEDCRSQSEVTGKLPIWQFYTKVRNVVNAVPLLKSYAVHEKLPSESDESAKADTSNIRFRSSANQADSFLNDDVATADNIDNHATDNINRHKHTGFQTGKSADTSTGTKKQVDRLADTAAMWQRLNMIEKQLDDLSDQHEMQNQTNSLLSQILTELSSLANNVAPDNTNNTDDTNRVKDDITIVVPQSQ